MTHFPAFGPPCWAVHAERAEYSAAPEAETDGFAFYCESQKELFFSTDMMAECNRVLSPSAKRFRRTSRLMAHRPCGCFNDGADFHRRNRLAGRCHDRPIQVLEGEGRRGVALATHDHH